MNNSGMGPALGWACVPDPVAATPNPTQPAPGAPEAGFKSYTAKLIGYATQNGVVNLFRQALTSGPEQASLVIPNGGAVTVTGPNVYGNNGNLMTPVLFNGQPYYVLADQLSQNLQQALQVGSAYNGPLQPRIGVGMTPPAAPSRSVGGALGTTRNLPTPQIGSGLTPQQAAAVPPPMTLQQLLQRGRL